MIEINVLRDWRMSTALKVTFVITTNQNTAPTELINRTGNSYILPFFLHRSYVVEQCYAFRQYERSYVRQIIRHEMFKRDCLANGDDWAKIVIANK